MVTNHGRLFDLIRRHGISARLALSLTAWSMNWYGLSRSVRLTSKCTPLHEVSRSAPPARPLYCTVRRAVKPSCTSRAAASSSPRAPLALLLMRVALEDSERALCVLELRVLHLEHAL